MGSSASKAARRLPTKTPSAVHAPVSVPNPPAAAAAASASSPNFNYGRQQPAPFSGEKDEALIRDGGDPQLLANLATLGQVRVSTPQFVTPTKGQSTLKARKDEYTSAKATPPPGTLRAESLANMLDEMKVRRLEEVAPTYGMEPGVVASLAKWVNAPSVAGEEKFMKETGNQVHEVVEMKAVWVDGPK